MARYSTGHKDATHRRMVEAYGPRCKRDGIDGSGIATLMSDAGLTNGAFFFTPANGAQLAHLATLCENKTLRPVLDRTFDFDLTLDAMAYAKQGRANGKPSLAQPPAPGADS